MNGVFFFFKHCISMKIPHQNENTAPKKIDPLHQLKNNREN